MPLDPTSFVPKGPVKSLDIRQFYDLFTGVMVDQPITFRNAVSIGGDQGVATVPLRIFGALGQNTNLIDLYPDRTSAQPGFGFSALGSFAWGPGGTAPQDTFLSRVATQHGYVSDTPGLLVTPMLQIGGPLNAETNFIVDALGQNSGGGIDPGVMFGGRTGEGISSQRSSGNPNRFGLDFWTGGGIHMRILTGGDIQMSGNLTLAASVNAGGDGNFHYVTVSDGSNGVITTRNGSLYLRPQPNNWIVVDNGSQGIQLPGSGSFYAPNGYVAAGTAVSGSPGDLSANRGNNTGYCFLANGSHYIGFDGTYYQLPTSGLNSAQIILPAGPNALNFGGIPPDSALAPLVFNQTLGAKINFYDNGGGSYWGFGMDNAMMYASVQKGANTFAVRNPTDGRIVWYTDGDGNSGQVGDIRMDGTRVVKWPSGCLVSPGMNIGKSGDTIYLANHAYVFFDLGVGHVITCQQVIQTSDPSLKAVTGTLTDDQCMGRIRGGIPVYQYQLAPPTPPPDQQPIPIPTQTDIGFMATDVYANSPEFAALDGQGNPIGVNYANMSALIWGALRQLDKRCTSKGI